MHSLGWNNRLPGFRIIHLMNRIGKNTRGIDHYLSLDFKLLPGLFISYINSGYQTI